MDETITVKNKNAIDNLVYYSEGSIWIAPEIRLDFMRIKPCDYSFRILLCRARRYILKEIIVRSGQIVHYIYL